MRKGSLRISKPGPCITNVFATRRKNFSQWYRSFQRKLLSHWLKFLRHVAITLVIQGPELLGSYNFIIISFTTKCIMTGSILWTDAHLFKRHSVNKVAQILNGYHFTLGTNHFLLDHGIPSLLQVVKLYKIKHWQGICKDMYFIFWFKLQRLSTHNKVVMTMAQYPRISFIG